MEFAEHESTQAFLILNVSSEIYLYPPDAAEANTNRRTAGVLICWYQKILAKR